MSPTRVLIKAYGDWSNVNRWAYEHSAFLGWIVPDRIQRVTDELGHPIPREAIEVEVADCRHYRFLESYGCRNTGPQEGLPDLDVLIFIDTNLFEPGAFDQRLAEFTEEVRAALHSTTNGNDPFPEMRFQVCQMGDPVGTPGRKPRERVAVDT